MCVCTQEDELLPTVPTTPQEGTGGTVSSGESGFPDIDIDIDSTQGQYPYQHHYHTSTPVPPLGNRLSCKSWVESSYIRLTELFIL